MSGDHWAVLIWVGIGLFFALLIPPLRAVLAVVFKQVWALLVWLGLLLWQQAQAIMLRVWRAHMVLFGNLLPRNAVLPSVAKKTTRKD